MSRYCVGQSTEPRCRVWNVSKTPFTCSQASAGSMSSTRPGSVKDRNAKPGEASSSMVWLKVAGPKPQRP